MASTDGYFPDQPIVRGADVIYRPKNNAGEYAPLATNPWVGCGHGCKYCYVPKAMHINPTTFHAGAVPRPDFLDRLARDIPRHKHLIGTEADQIFVTFSSDPFHPGNMDHTRRVFEMLQDGGLAICTLSKGGTKALEFISMYRPDRDAYAATLTTVDDVELARNWEPNAASPADRIRALRFFYESGIFTWASLEPTLNAESSLAIIRATHGFVNHYKIGKANYLGEFGRRIDWRDYTLRMIDLCQALGVSHYIKRDLQQYLPEGYPNPLRVVQRHPKGIAA
jgi:DNA repair photolyase